MTAFADSPAALASQLRTQIDGRVVEPDDADFDSLRAVANGAIDARPLLIARPVNDADVACIVAAARDSGLPLAVRSGGHSGAGHGVVEGGIVLDLRDMRAIDVDVDARTVWAETGLTAAEYATALGEHGLATGFGDTGSVGIGGITLGGGVGYLVRKYGLTIDDLLAADIVTADGEVRRVDADNEPDLFWAIRGGGGGNFGVATRFKFRARPRRGDGPGPRGRDGFRAPTLEDPPHGGRIFEGDDLPIRQQWVAELAAALHQGDTGAYVNFIGAEGAELVRAAYPGKTFDRLAEIKARYDPTNLFRIKQNIPPAGGPASLRLTGQAEGGP